MYSYQTFFQNLPGFNGEINLDDQGRYDFLCYEGVILFERPNLEKEFRLRFTKINEKYGEISCTCTEKNLVNVFTHSKEKRVVINHHEQITSEKIQTLFNWYNDGYQAAIKIPLTSELGITFEFLDLKSKIKLLRRFYLFCIESSYFEGFATPTCLYAIGYIQAFLLKAHKELLIIEALGIELLQKTREQHKEETKPEDTSFQFKIKVNNKETMRSIYDIWSVLHENLEDEIPKTVKSASELNYLLNQLFYCNGYKFEPEEKFEVNEFGDSHRYLLEFLMRISKAINKSNKITNVDYSNLLKKVFQSVYAQISDAETISKNWTNNNDDTMKLLYEKLGESHTLVRLFEKEIRKTNLSIKIRKK